jgi:hypothetical protein
MLSNFRACLAGLLFGSGSDSSRGALPNVFLKEPFFNKKQRSWSHFGEATNCGSSKTALAPPEEPHRRSHAKHPLKVCLKDSYFKSHFVCWTLNHFTSSDMWIIIRFKRESDSAVIVNIAVG